MELFLNPESVLKQLNLHEDMIAADFGSGSGGWSIPLAKVLDVGKVYAIDILEEALSALRTKAKLFKIDNIETVKADIEKGVKSLDEGSCDLVLMTNLLFECEDKKRVLQEGKRILKPGGQILVVDWKQKSALGPTEEGVNPAELKETALDLNLRVEKEFDAGPYHFGLILVK